MLPMSLVVLQVEQVAPAMAVAAPTRICVDANPTMLIVATMAIAAPTLIHVDATPSCSHYCVCRFIVIFKYICN